MKKEIFISSTYLDLKDYRHEVWDLLQLYKEKVSIRGMERFGARKTSSLETCINEVKKSDIYIGIIGVSFGSVHKESGKSYTQLEYEAAVENDCDIWIYLMDEENSKVHPSVIDYKNHDGLEKFKTILMNNHTYDDFKDPGDLKKKIDLKLRETIPDSKEILLPEKLECKISRFKIEEAGWKFFIGFHKGRVVQLFAGMDDDFWVPTWVQEGFLIRATYDYDGPGKETRIDFMFNDKKGYNITIEGVSRTFDPEIYSANLLISELLLHDVPIQRILDRISKLLFPSNPSFEKYREELSKVIQDDKN